MSGLQAAFSDTRGLRIPHRGRGALRTPTPHPTMPLCSVLPRTRGSVLTDVGEECGGLDAQMGHTAGRVPANTQPGQRLPLE